MTAPDLSPAELARVAAFDAAPEPAEVVEYRETVERAARAMHEVPAQPGVYGRIPWDRLMEQHRDACRQMAAAALTAAAPLAGQYTTDEEADRG